MFYQVDPSSAVPVYAQIMDQVKRGISSGLLKTGERLPSIRELARELRINPNTVVRAYRELEREGVVESRRGQGSYVAESQHASSLAARRELLAPAVDRLLVEAYHLGLNDDELRKLLELRMDERRRSGKGREA